MQATEKFVRIIIRRPHAYTFLNDLFEEAGGVVSGTPEGSVLGDELVVKLPGFYVLSPEGLPLGQAGVLAGDAGVDALLDLLDSQ